MLLVFMKWINILVKVGILDVKDFPHLHQLLPFSLFILFAYVVYLLHINVYGHTTLNTPALVRLLKLSKVDHLGIIFCPSLSAEQGSKRCGMFPKEHTVSYNP